MTVIIITIIITSIKWKDLGYGIKGFIAAEYSFLPCFYCNSVKMFTALSIVAFLMSYRQFFALWQYNQHNSSSAYYAHPLLLYFVNFFRGVKKNKTNFRIKEIKLCKRIEFVYKSNIFLRPLLAFRSSPLTAKMFFI